MDEIQEGLDEIYSMIKKSIEIIIEGKGRKEYRERLRLKFDEIDQKQRKVNLRIYDDIIKEKYCGMKGA